MVKAGSVYVSGASAGCYGFAPDAKCSFQCLSVGERVASHFSYDKVFVVYRVESDGLQSGDIYLSVVTYYLSSAEMFTILPVI